MKLEDLKDKDVGREVKYEKMFCDVEFGKITSWNDKYVFVCFHTKITKGVDARVEGTRTHMTGSTSQACRPCDIGFTL